MGYILKRVFGVLALLATIALVSLLGGSAIWVLDGAHDLDITGTPVPHGGPVSLPVDGWAYYGGDPGGHRFSRLDQINRENVGSLAAAWTYRTGDLATKGEALYRSAGETTPILVEDKLVFCTPFNEVIAVDPGNGKEIWRYDPGIDLDQSPANQFICRGVAYWHDETAGGACASRIFTGTSDGQVIALDASSGTPCAGFGEAGRVTVDPGMPLIWPGEFQITSPPAVVGDTVVIGSAIGDNVRVKAPHGTVHAYDTRTGAEKWWFDPIPRTTDAPNADNWLDGFPPIEGHANTWAPMSADIERGLVFIPTSSPSPDFYGGLRPGDNRYANSVVALDAESGNVAWSFQMVHHDVWDFDIPAQPGLYTIWKDGQARDVVAQVTKMGLVFVLDRDTGEPVIPVEERPVPQDGVAGEALSPTQPFPASPPRLVPDTTTGDDAFGITWFDRHACANAIEALRTDGLYTPPTEQGTLMRPFTGGGANWGGAAFDASRNLLVVNVSNVAHLIQAIPADKVAELKRAMPNTEIAPQAGAPFGVRRELLLSPLGVPCTAPPWGLLVAVDIARGTIVWRRSLGTIEDIGPGLPLPLGTPTLGGPVVTAGNLIFIAGTLDFYLRAFDIESGDELWKARLPGAATATPMTYEWRGRQYVVIFSGGYSTADAPPADSLVAFALPR